MIRKDFELKSEDVIIDPRGPIRKIWDALEYPTIPFIWALISIPVILLWSGFIPFALIIFLVLRYAVVSKPDVLPIHLPMDAGKEDLNDPKIGEGRGFNKARGAFYMGVIRKLRYEVWLNFKALTQHFLIFGTTGAGKTEAIVSFIVNYLAAGSGVAFQDAKAAPKAMIQMATICRIFGRDDDFRVTNYITGLTSGARDPAERLSNDAAVFARGSAESNTQLLVSLMPPSEGDNKIFGERAIALVSALFPALTDLRDLGAIQIDPNVIRRSMAFNVFASLFKDNRISRRSREALVAYLESLPGYDEKKAIGEQPEEVTRQFGFAQAYFTRSLAALSDTYGHIYMVGQGEIDYQDVVLNGRILLTLLPSMEKSGEELANLGKIVLTALRSGMVVGLGTVFEGSSDDIVHSLPTNSEVPFGVMNDENAYMLVEGQEIINAQARGLGFGVLTGTQDAPGMLENISRTTKQIMANSAIKLIMYIDDKETTELAMDFSGEATVMVRNRFERVGDMGGVYASKDVSVEQRKRITETDIKKQQTGQGFTLYQGAMHEIQVFNHGISEKGSDPLRRYVDHWYPVRLAKVKVPTTELIAKYMQVHPRQEWDDIQALVADKSRQMHKEITTFFASQLVIRGIAKMYAANSLDDWNNTQGLVANQLLAPAANESAMGLVGKIAESNIRNLKDVLALAVEIAAQNNTAQTRLQAEADLANLDSFDDMPLLDAGAFEIEGEAGGDSGSDTTAPAPANQEDALNLFLGPDYIDPPMEQVEPGNAVASSHNQEDEKALVQDAPEPTSVVAQAVSRNLAAMPWFQSEEEVAQVKNAIIETELMFNGDDMKSATNAAEETIESIIRVMEYPETKIDATSIKDQDVRDLLKGWLD